MEWFGCIVFCFVLDIVISPQLGISYTTIILSCVGMTAAFMHHNRNSMIPIGTCTDSVKSVYNISWIYLSRGNSCVIKQIHFNTHRGRMTHINVSILYHHWFRQSLAACLATTHYHLNQWWFVVNYTLIYRRQYPIPSLVQTMVRRLFSDNPLSEPMMVCCQLD